MMDWSSVMYAGLVIGGAIAVLWTLSAESSTVSISGSPVRTTPRQIDLTSLPKVA